MPEATTRQRVAPVGVLGVWPDGSYVWRTIPQRRSKKMFESLSGRLGKILDGLRGRDALSAGDVDAALREIRRALIEADVSLEVVRAFVEQVKDRAIGAEATRSVPPGQQVIKIVHDELVAVLG